MLISKAPCVKFSFVLVNVMFVCHHIIEASAKDFQPVNRHFTAEGSEPRPDLECVVGVHSASTSELYRVRCDQAWNITIKYGRKQASDFLAKKYISEHDRRLRIIKFGIEGSGIKYNAHAYWKNWTRPIANWVCGYHPISATIIFDCIPENQAPPWWKTPLMGPAFPTGHKPAPKEMRKPGCNGGVCYCNKENYCNDRHQYTDPEEECPQYLDHHKWDLRCQKQMKTEL